MLKKNRLVVFLILLIVISVLIVFLYNRESKRRKEEEITRKNNEIIENIKSHYGTSVLTNKKTKLYKYESGEYLNYGEINSDVYLELDEINIDPSVKYFHITELDLYIYFEDVNACSKQEKSDRYKNYIYFNTNIITDNPTSFYDENENFLYSLNDSFDFKVIVNTPEKYGVEFNNQLLYIKKDNVKETYDNNNTELGNKSKIMTLTYHFIYDPNEESCNESICQTLDMFESHLKYIRDNNYFTLKLNELELYMDGYIKIPTNSIVLTIDDGTVLNQKALSLLEKYEANATLFVITGWVDPSTFNSKYLDLESHTDHMHNQYECGSMGNQGGGILCLAEDYVLDDLKTCQEKLGGSVYFSYPFFDFNARAISLLKQAGYHMAFIGQYDTNGYSYPNVTDKFKIRRKTIFSSTSMDEFISYLKG